MLLSRGSGLLVHSSGSLGGIIIKQILGIIGGMGPQATIDFQQKVLNNTSAVLDQEHIHVITDSFPQIPDRISAALEDGESPAPYIQEALDRLISHGVKCIAMPCITAHYFLPGVSVPQDVRFLNMIETAGLACQKRAGKTAGVLSSSGTAKTGIVTEALDKLDVEYVCPNEFDQDVLAKLILNVKAKRDMSDTVKRFRRITENMAAMGAEYFLLACTEIPIIAQAYSFPYDFVDATTELARAAVTACGYALTDR